MSRTSLDRRKLLVTSAWAVPVIVTAAAAPATAASGGEALLLTDLGTTFSATQVQQLVRVTNQSPATTVAAGALLLNWDAATPVTGGTLNSPGWSVANFDQETVTFTNTSDLGPGQSLQFGPDVMNTAGAPRPLTVLASATGLTSSSLVFPAPAGRSSDELLSPISRDRLAYGTV